MTQEEYEQKRKECWEDVKFALRAPNTAREVFEFIFNRAFVLGKQAAELSSNSEQLSVEVEEVLTVKANVVKDLYNSLNKTHPKEHAWIVKQTLESLFGSKCLPDELLFQIPAENCNNGNHISKSDNKPAEATENVNLSQETANCDKRFDNILKDSFSKERRLNIAAIVLAGIVAREAPARHPVTRALELADALIAKCEKGFAK